MNYKKKVYETGGVREYWVINPKKGVLLQYENVKNQFVLKNTYKMDEVVTSFVVEGFAIKVGDLYV
jgi:Uma2 family endonuclease